MRLGIRLTARRTVTVYVVFLKTAADRALRTRLAGLCSDTDAFQAHECELYCRAGNGIGQSPAAIPFAKAPKCRMGRRRRHKRAHRLPQRWRPGLQVPGRMRDASYEHLLQNCRAEAQRRQRYLILRPRFLIRPFIRPFYGSSAGGAHTLMTHPLGPANASPHLQGSRRRPYRRRNRPK